MNREAELQRYLKAHHPEIRFVDRPPNDAGFYFGVMDSDLETLVPIVHPFTLWDRSAVLDDEEFGQLLLALSGLIDLVYELTDQQSAEWTEETMSEARSIMLQTTPAQEAILAKCWEIT